MDVCGHNESDVELNLRTLRENQRIEKILSFLLFRILKNMYVKVSNKNLKNPFHQGITVHIINYIYYK